MLENDFTKKIDNVSVYAKYIGIQERDSQTDFFEVCHENAANMEYLIDV